MFVKIYAESRERENCPLELVQFLDMDESGGCAISASEETFLTPLNRSRFTFIQ